MPNIEAEIGAAVEKIESLPSVEKKRGDLPQGKDLSRKIDNLVKEVESLPNKERLDADLASKKEEAWMPAVGKSVFVKRTDGEIDGGWEVSRVENGIAYLLKPDANNPGRTFRKSGPVEELERLNEKGKIDFSQAENFSDLYKLINYNGPVRGSSREYSPDRLQKIIEDVKSKKVGLEMVTQTGNLRQAVTKLLEKEPDAEMKTLDERIMGSRSFADLREVIGTSQLSYKKQVLAALNQTEAVVKESLAKGKNFQTLSPDFVKSIPETHGLSRKIRQIASDFFASANGETRSGKEKLISEKSKIVFPPEAVKAAKPEPAAGKSPAELVAGMDKEIEELDKKMAAPDAGMSNWEVGERYLAKHPVSPFGRRPERIEKEPYDPAIEEYKASNKLVGDSGAKKSRREYDPVDGIIRRLDELTKSEDIHDRVEAARILREMTPEQTAKLPEKMPPELIRRLMKIEAPGFGRRPERKEKDFPVADERARERGKIFKVENGKRKIIKSRREYDPDAPRVSPPDEKGAPEPAGAEPRQRDNPNNLPREELDNLRRFGPSKAEAFGREVEEKIFGGERKNKNESFHKKFKNLLADHPIATQIFKTGAASVASILGVKSFYDVPAYFTQRYAVRGNIFGIGHGKNLADSVEELVAANKASKEKRRGEKPAKKEGSTEKSAVDQAIDDLNKRLAKTKEGTTKGSEQRKMLAELLKANRNKEQQTKEERRKELENILDNYTNTKVSGIQAAREALNTACMATGAISLRGVTYGGLAFFEKREEMRHQAQGEANRKGTEAKAEYVSLEQVFIRGLKETYNGITLQTGRNKKEKSIAAIKSFGSIARFAGIAFGMGTGGHAYHGDLEKVINAFEGKVNFSDIGHNFIHNAERYLKLMPNLVNSMPHLPGAALGAEASHQFSSAPADSAAGKLPSMVTPEGAPAAVEPIPEIQYQGGNSIWNELKQQLAARYGKDFDGLSEAAKNESINILANRITGNPAAFGLPTDVDFTKLTKADLEKIPWNNFFGNEETPAAAVHNLGKTLAEPGENLKHFGGGAGREWTPEESQHNAENFFESKAISDELAKMSERARHLNDGTLGQIEKQKFYDEFERLRSSVKNLTNGTLFFDPSGDWNIKMPNNEIMNVFHAQGPLAINIEKGAGMGSGMVTAEEYLPPDKSPLVGLTADEAERLEIKIPAPDMSDEMAVAAAGPAPEAPEFHRPSLGYQNAPAPHETDVSGHEEAEPLAPSAVGAIEPTIDWQHPAKITGSFDDVAAAKRMIAHQGKNLDLRKVTSISPEVLEILAGKKNGAIILTGLYPENIPPELAEKTFQALTEVQPRGGVAMNDEMIKWMEKNAPVNEAWLPPDENLEVTAAPNP
ncbi:MAG: hypothetical protein PHE24_02370 [Patescibacteria group bacterium]|nr:hypothetical protein [Patescibacteria group bacterium]